MKKMLYGLELKVKELKQKEDRLWREAEQEGRDSTKGAAALNTLQSVRNSFYSSFSNFG